MGIQEKIITEVKNYYGVDIFGKSHRRDDVLPRQIAQYLMILFSDTTLRDVGKIWGTDHSTVLHSFNQVRSLCKFNEIIRKQVIELESKLE